MRLPVLLSVLLATATLLVSAPGSAQQPQGPGEGAEPPPSEDAEGGGGTAGQGDSSADGTPSTEAPEHAAALQAPTGEVPEPPGGSRRVAVLVLATAGVEAETADSLTELAIGAVAQRGGVTIVGKEEFQAGLGQGEAGSLECVSSAACLGRIGVELDVDEVIAGTISRRDGKWLFNLNRIEIRTGELAGRAFREVEGDLGAVADAIQDAVPALYEEVHQPATLLVSASVDGAEVTVDGILVGVFRGDPVRVDDVSAGHHRIVVAASGHERWQRTVQVAEGATLQLDADLEEPEEPGAPYVSPLVWVGAGIAAAGAGTAVFFGISSQRSAGGDLNRAEAEEFVEARRTEALVANVALGTIAAGAAVAGVGLLLSDLDGSDEPGGTTVGAAPVRGGAVGIVEGSF